MRFKRSATIVGAALFVGGLGTAAFAAGSLTPNVVSDSSPESIILVSWSGLSSADGSVFIQQCWKNGNAPGVTFDYLADCNNSIGTNAAIAASGAGSKNLTVFNGDEPNLGEWGCGPLTSAGLPTNGTATCYVRLAPVSKENVTSDDFIPFSYGATNPVVPEVPLNILLPISAAAVLGAGIFFIRKQQLKSIAA